MPPSPLSSSSSSSWSSSSSVNKLASIMSRWIQSFSRTGRDGMALTRALWTAHRSSTTSSRGTTALMKPVLLEQARQSNRVATSLLFMEKEYGLFKYFGWRGYLQQRIRSSSSSSSTQTPPGNSPNSAITSAASTDDSTKEPAQKIAFMITASMKQMLQETLGYDPEQIKKMTPMQASLVLNHNVSPDKFDEQLPVLEKAYEEEQEALRQQQEERAKLEHEQQQEQQRQPTDSTLAAPPYYVFEDTSSSLSPAELASAIGAESGFEEAWFELMEIKPSGDAVRQGLYPNMAEAELGLETREMIRDRQMEKDQHRYGGDHANKEYSTYEIREVSRSEIMRQQA